MTTWNETEDICPTCRFPKQRYGHTDTTRCACRSLVTQYRQAAIDSHQAWYTYGINCVRCGAPIERHLITDERRCQCEEA